MRYWTTCRSCFQYSFTPLFSSTKQQRKRLVSVSRNSEIPMHCQKWATSWENLFMPYANNKGADQPARPRSLISAFAVRCLDSIIPTLVLQHPTFQDSGLLTSVAEQAGLSHCLKAYLVVKAQRQGFSWRGSKLWNKASRKTPAVWPWTEEEGISGNVIWPIISSS